MGTKAVDETDLKDAKSTDAEVVGKETRKAAETEDAVVAEGAAVADGADGALDDEDFEQDEDGADAAGTDKGAASAGVGQGAVAVVAAALGVVGLSGGWLGTVASARESLIGQLKTSQSASVAEQVQQVYGDSWKTTALVGGLFALAALVTGVAVLLRPAFGDPGRVQAPWIKSVAWAGVALGVIGLALAIAKYSNIILGLPSTA
ncbi:hypothetical protein ABT390_34535 [Streptomyces aurantiacus]|uniref:Uncharacterized protein n=1 Tax=Streptomyces aurantiacus JA 4570 TaxID=1286094 RepID=S3ZIP4_9ACTN|nr:hypothetical protein [Streptomyces aurantiacus]EPH43023.1 hypothetical protein STRAU_3907 [Streptomyces aurantiacus JA 4570]